MRLFLAIEIPEAIREAVAASISKVRDRLPAARWVRPENFHLTLRFLGEVEEEVRERLLERLEPVVDRHERFWLRLGVGGTFPPGRPARTVWIGLENPEALAALALDVRSATDDFVQQRRSNGPARPFSAHLTVARCRRPWPRVAVEDWKQIFPGPTGERFLGSRCVMMRSRLGAGGARYDVVRLFPLGSN